MRTPKFLKRTTKPAQSNNRLARRAAKADLNAELLRHAMVAQVQNRLRMQEEARLVSEAVDANARMRRTASSRVRTPSPYVHTPSPYVHTPSPRVHTPSPRGRSAAQKI
jgi:hypothetical protein